ncbi:MAG: M15 family metallopeptidase [Firmicutes bacterium]|nr:M15 family metallopeptidase [Bacillota bacterium]
MAKENKAKKKKKKNKNKNSGFSVLSIIIIVLMGVVFLGVGFMGGYIMPGIFFGGDEEETVAVVEDVVYPQPRTDYELIVNRSNPLTSEEFIGGSGELVELEEFDDVQLETQTAEALTKMLADMRFEGIEVTVFEGYRSAEAQESAYNKAATGENGELIAAVTVGAPLTDEHQTGLAVDLTVDGTLSASFDYSEAGKWLKEHCAEYGFILRYTASGEKSTGREAQPWHFRYVGDPEVAKLIMHSGKTMEQYYGMPLNAEDIDPYVPFL